MRLSYTRSIINAIHDGSLLEASYSPTPIFKLQVPDRVNGVPVEILHPENMVSLDGRYVEFLLKICQMPDFRVIIRAVG